MKKLLSSVLASTLLLSSFATTAVATPAVDTAPTLASTQTLSTAGLSYGAAAAYYNIITGYEASYGTFTHKNSLVGKIYELPSGVIFSKLVDMNKNGSYELVVCYISKGSPKFTSEATRESFTCHLEFWTYDNNEATRFYHEELANSFESLTDEREFTLVQDGDTPKLLITSASSLMINFEWAVNTIQLGGSILDAEGVEVEFADNEVYNNEIYTAAANSQDGSFSMNASRIKTTFSTHKLAYKSNPSTLLLSLTMGGSSPSISDVLIESCKAELEEVIDANNPEYPDWAKTYIEFVADDIMPDISVLNYNSPSSRGLIAQTLYNMCGNGATPTTTSQFTDVGAEYATAVAWCNENQLMNGESEDFFGAYKNVEREQFALVLNKLASLQGLTTSNSTTSVLDPFLDGTQVSSWAKTYMAWAVTNKMMQGSDNKLNPKGEITRAEVAVMLYNFNNL